MKDDIGFHRLKGYVSHFRKIYDINQIVNLAKFFIGLKLGRCINNPVSCEFYITNKCNLRCKHCNVWRDSAHRTSSSNELSYEEIIDLLIDLKRIGVKHIGYSGGEPFLKERFLDVLRVGHELGFHQVVSTNGTLIDENVARILVKYVDGVGISIDGPPDVHDKIRGVEGSFNKAMKALKILNSLKKNFAGIGFVISKLNYREIPRMLDLARSLGVGIGFQPVHIFGVVFPRKSNHPFEDISFNDEDVTELARIIQYLIAQGYCAGNPIKEEYVKGIVDFIRGEKKRLCVVGYLGLTIGPDGSVYPCSFSHKVGNVRERSIEEIWKSPDYYKTRRDMLSCKKCYLGCYEAINIPINKFLTKFPFIYQRLQAKSNSCL